MRLSTYLRDKRLTTTEFARLVNATPSVVRTWVTGLRIPSHRYITSIYRVTKGAVDANEFHGLKKRPAKAKEAAE